MKILYKVEVWIKADIEPGTTEQQVLNKINDVPTGLVNFIEGEDYLTGTEQFILPTKEATLMLYDDDNNLIYKNK